MMMRFWLALAVVLSGPILMIPGTTANAGTVRQYYIAAEQQEWDYAPSGKNLLHMGLIPKPWTNFTRWEKTRYVEYTDATFKTKKAQPNWLGVLGPVIRAEVGDEIRIRFLNRADGYYGIHPHGVRYDKNSEGAHYFGSDGTPPGLGGQVAPGAMFDYTWFADAESGPAPGQPSSLVWWYHSHVDEPEETNAGLLGPIIITRAGMAHPDGRPNDVDREFVVMFFVFDEAGGMERGLMHSMNGFIFGNLPGLSMNQGEKVRWHVLGMGSEIDLHTAHWHGKTLLSSGRRTDVIELLPGSMMTADMNADNPGTWLFHCHVADHITAGMVATYTIHAAGSQRQR